MLQHLAKRFISTMQTRLLIRRVPRALEGGPSERQHLLGAGREDSEWGEGLPKVRCRRTSRFGHLFSQCPSASVASMHNGYVGSAARSSQWMYALRSGVRPDRRRVRRTASARLKVAMQLAFQAKFSHTTPFGGCWAGIGDDALVLHRTTQTPGYFT